MARKPKSVVDIDKEIEALKAARAAAMDARAAHIGKLAAKAELTMLDMSDADLLEAFKTIAVRFRKQGATPAAAPHGPTTA